MLFFCPMLPEDYNADAICRAMNLSRFVDPDWRECEFPTLRILLTPSFHPEACITISRQEDRVFVSVDVFTKLFRGKDFAAGRRGHERISVSAEKYEEWLSLFKTACVSAATSERFVYLDGMGFESCLVSRVGEQRLKAHASQPANTAFLSGILELVWSNCNDSRVRNVLADAASYVGLKFPRQVDPPLLPTCRIAVLGTPEARKEYFEVLQKVKGKKSKQ